MAGGFECNFAEKVSKGIQFKYPICLLVPYQATCCGKSFCKECIHCITADLKPCPTCKNENFNNNGLQQSLYDFQICCTHKSKGCEWIGELRELDNHVNSDPPADKALQGCLYALIKCPLGYEIKLAHQDMPSHIKDRSLHPFNTPPARKEFQIHLLSKEQYLIGSAHENGVELGRCFDSNQSAVPVELIMTDFEQHRKNNDIWYSPGFHTHPSSGYKMCLAVHANGWAKGRAKCIAVYVHLMQGGYDEKLEWPFRGDVHVQLLNWEEKEPHMRMIPFDETAQKCTARRVVGGERAELGCGLCKFALHRDILAKYLRNDCL